MLFLRVGGYIYLFYIYPDSLSLRKIQKAMITNDVHFVEPKAPTVGRIVLYYPNKEDKQARENQQMEDLPVCPAIVSQIFKGNDPYMANLHVFANGWSTGLTTLLRGSVPHKSQASEGASYWDWPERN